MAAIHVWMILFMFFFFIELMTISLVSIWFCAGSAVAILACYLKMPLWVQIIAFVVVSATCFGLFLPLRKKIISLKKTNADVLVGEKCTVTKKVSDEKYFGEVTVRGQHWSAVSEGETIQVGEKAIITNIEGAHLIIRKEES